MDLGLAGARALIGGGSGGLGGAIATTLRAEGATVGLIARPSDRLDEQAKRLDALAVPADLSTVDGPADAVAAGVAAFGGLDLRCGARSASCGRRCRTCGLDGTRPSSSSCRARRVSRSPA
jgi:NAD(P)-dependent dehydrogenase (short-subunit alcohol dehydrogenase family)